MQYDVIRHAGHRADMLHDVVDMQYAEVFTCIRSSIERKASRLSRSARRLSSLAACL